MEKERHLFSLLNMLKDVDNEHSVSSKKLWLLRLLKRSTPLIRACYGTNEDKTIRDLDSNRTNGELQNILGVSAMMLTFLFGKRTTVQFLLEQGAKVWTCIITLCGLR